MIGPSGKSVMSPRELADHVARAERAKPGDGEPTLHVAAGLIDTRRWTADEREAFAALLSRTQIAWFCHHFAGLIEKDLAAVVELPDDLQRAEVARHSWRWDRAAGREPMPAT